MFHKRVTEELDKLGIEYRDTEGMHILRFEVISYPSDDEIDQLANTLGATVSKVPGNDGKKVLRIESDMLT